MDTQFKLLVLLMEHYNKTGYKASYRFRVEVEDLVFRLSSELREKSTNVDDLIRKCVFGHLMDQFCRVEDYDGPEDDLVDYKAEEAADVAEEWERRLPIPLYGLRAPNARIFHRSDRKALHRGHRCGRK
jgi:hypothetical protein